MSNITTIFTSQYDHLSTIIAENVHAMFLEEVHRELKPALDKMWSFCKQMAKLQDIFQQYASQNRVFVTRIIRRTSVTHLITLRLTVDSNYDTYYDFPPFVLEFDWDFLEWQRLNPVESWPFDVLRHYYGTQRTSVGGGEDMIPLMVGDLPTFAPFHEFTDKKIFHSLTPGFVGLEVIIHAAFVVDVVLDE